MVARYRGHFEKGLRLTGVVSTCPCGKSGARCKHILTIPGRAIDAPSCHRIEKRDRNSLKFSNDPFSAWPEGLLPMVNDSGHLGQVGWLNRTLGGVARITRTPTRCGCPLAKRHGADLCLCETCGHVGVSAPTVPWSFPILCCNE